jgi:hypothetical protein
MKATAHTVRLPATCCAPSPPPCRWYVPPSAGPGPNGPSTQLWVYRSNIDATRDTQAGLAGPLVVSRPGGLNAQGKTADVDKEVYLMLQVRMRERGGGEGVW